MKVSHVTTVKGEKFTTELIVPEVNSLEAWMEVVKARGLSDEAAEDVLCRYILNAVKLEHNAWVAGPIRAKIIKRREKAEKMMPVDRFPQWKEAKNNGSIGDFLDSLADEFGIE